MQLLQHTEHVVWGRMRRCRLTLADAAVLRHGRRVDAGLAGLRELLDGALAHALPCQLLLQVAQLQTRMPRNKCSKKY